MLLLGVASNHTTPLERHTMKKISGLLAVAAIATLALTGCAGPSEPTVEAPVGSEQGTLKMLSVELPDSKAVDCVASKYTGSVVMPSCDWANVYSFSGEFTGDSATLKSFTVKGANGKEVICVASKYTGSRVDPDCNWDGVEPR